MVIYRREPVDLKDIVEKEKAVFADSSALINDDKGFFRIFFERGYNISPDELKPYIPPFFESDDILCNNNLHLISEVIKELVRGHTVFREMQKHNNKTFRIAECHHHKIGEKRRETQRLIQELGADYAANIRKARSLEFKPSKQQVYAALSSIVEEISSLNRLKEDKHIYFSDRRRSKSRTGLRFEDLKTDERLVAAALYWSLVKREGSSVVTRDGDIVRIFRASVFSFIEAGKNSEFYKSIADAVQKNPIDIYVAYLDEELNRTPMYCLSDNVLNQRAGKVYMPIAMKSQHLLTGRCEGLMHSGLPAYLY